MTTQTQIPFEKIPIHDAGDGLEILTHGDDVITVRTADGENVKINGIPYSLTAILYRNDDGTWGVGHEHETYQGFEGPITRTLTNGARWYGSLFGTRRDRFMDIDGFTAAAKPKAVAIAERVGNEWANAHPDLLIEGDVRQNRQQTRRLLDDRAKLAEQIAMIDAEIAELGVVS